MASRWMRPRARGLEVPLSVGRSSLAWPSTSLALPNQLRLRCSSTINDPLSRSPSIFISRHFVGDGKLLCSNGSDGVRRLLYSSTSSLTKAAVTSLVMRPLQLASSAATRRSYFASPAAACPRSKSGSSSSTSIQPSTAPTSPSPSSSKKTSSVSAPSEFTTTSSAPRRAEGGAATATTPSAATAEEAKTPTLAWLEAVEAKLARGGNKAKESAHTRSVRALRTELAEAVRAGRLSEAERLWGELRGRVGATRMDEASFHLLMNAYAQRGHLRRALALYAHMREWRVRPSVHTYSILFNAYANLAKPSPSYISRLRQLKDVDMPKYKVKPTVEIYNVLLKAYLALDPEQCKKEVKQMISDMAEMGLKPDDVTYTLWMATAARGSANNPKASVDVPAAFEVWEEMRKNRVRPNVRGYNELLKICNDGSSEDRKIALELYKEMLVDGVTPDHRTFDILLMTCMKENKFDMANELFDKAVELNADKKKVVLDTHLCNSALRVCTRLNEKKFKEEDANKHLLNSINKILRVMYRNHLPYNEDTYALLISAYARARANDKAKAALQEMIDKGQVPIGRKTIGALIAASRGVNDVEGVRDAVKLAIQQRVQLPENMVEEAHRLFLNNKRYKEWHQLERELARFTVKQANNKSIDVNEEDDPAPVPLYFRSPEEKAKRQKWRRYEKTTPPTKEGEPNTTPRDKQTATTDPRPPGGAMREKREHKKDGDQDKKKREVGRRSRASSNTRQSGAPDLATRRS